MSQLALNGRRASDCPKQSIVPRVFFFFFNPPPSALHDGSCSSRSLVRAEGRIFTSKIISSSIASDRKRRITLQQTTVRAPSAMTPLTYTFAHILLLYYNMRTYTYIIITVVRSRKTSVEYYYKPVIFFLLPGFIVFRARVDDKIYRCSPREKRRPHSTSSGARPTVLILKNMAFRTRKKTNCDYDP